ncbi:Aminopeptidase 2 mitochondrial [Stygiomarasmius scandens]|uniref:Aminopeptidase 2 mitochondrial n=1 Tax=Marasmiellus scandens TaxID=2682957 RepID=A0ABR1JLR9_9AGAR
MSTSKEHRLPTNVKPRHYDLVIQADLDNSLFKGFVKIKLVRKLPACSRNNRLMRISLGVKEPTSTIVLNSDELKLEEARVHSDGFQEELTASDISVNVKEKRATFTFPTTFGAGTQLQLKVKFTGEFSEWSGTTEPVMKRMGKGNITL